MAGSLLLRGSRAGGVGLLVLLLLGLLQLPPALCARPIKVRFQSGAGGGGAGDAEVKGRAASSQEPPQGCAGTLARVARLQALVYVRLSGRHIWAWPETCGAVHSSRVLSGRVRTALCMRLM